VNIKSGQRELSAKTHEILSEAVSRVMPFSHLLFLVGMDKDTGDLILIGSAEWPEEVGAAVLRTLTHTLEEWAPRP